MDRDELLFMMRVSEESENYADMVAYAKEMIKRGEELTVRERNYISVAYKNALASKRCWRSVSSSEFRELNRGNLRQARLCEKYRLKIEDEVNTLCLDLVSLIDDHILSRPSSPQETIFFLKMQANYLDHMGRYMSEGPTKFLTFNRARSLLELALSLSLLSLSPSHPLRLHIVLSLSVLLYEVLACPYLALQVARNGWEQAYPEVDTLGEEDYKDRTIILTLIRDNINQFTTDMGNELDHA